MQHAIFFDIGGTLVRTADTKQWQPGAKQALTSLFAKGIPVGLLSNTRGLTRVQLAGLLPSDFPWAQFAPALILLSSEVGVEKPKLGIFRQAISKSGLSAADCLYCSENLVETLAAQQTGMHGARILPGELAEPATLAAIGAA